MWSTICRSRLVLVGLKSRALRRAPEFVDCIGSANRKSEMRVQIAEMSIIVGFTDGDDPPLHYGGPAIPITSSLVGLWTRAPDRSLGLYVRNCTEGAVPAQVPLPVL